MRTLQFIIFSTLSTFIILVNSQASQIDSSNNTTSDTSTSNLTDTQNTNSTHTNSTPSTNCAEFDSYSVCIQNEYCCYVALSYYSYNTKQCVDIIDSTKKEYFCDTIYRKTIDERFGFDECACFNYRSPYASAVFYSYSRFFILLSVIVLL